MPVTISVVESGMTRVVANLESIPRRMTDLTIPMKEAGLYMLRSINKNFDSGGRPEPWVPLTAETLREKARKGYSSQPLLRSGVLKGSIVYEATRDSLIIGTSVKYAAIHQFGSLGLEGGAIKQGARKQTLAFGSQGFRSRASASRSRASSIKVRFATIGSHEVFIPQRSFLLFQDEDIQIINQMILDYLARPTDYMTEAYLG